ncbi:IPT/TIG domain-containing protein [Candidatus Poribacteria bacterium]|nr:IPT/TIG domain-containing protein [Candidatus Poribacteria bacterium]
MTIEGEHLLDGATVLIGGIKVVPLSITPTHLTFTTPPSTEGAKPVVVRNVDAKVGFVDNGDTYTDTPLSPADINGDGVVNILDLVRVASEFGQSGDDLPGDVNVDGTVNILDLVLVVSQFGQLPAAAPQVE